MGETEREERWGEGGELKGEGWTPMKMRPISFSVSAGNQEGRISKVFAMETGGSQIISCPAPNGLK